MCLSSRPVQECGATARDHMWGDASHLGPTTYHNHLQTNDQRGRRISSSSIVSTTLISPSPHNNLQKAQHECDDADRHNDEPERGPPTGRLRADALRRRGESQRHRQSEEGRTTATTTTTVECSVATKPGLVADRPSRHSSLPAHRLHPRPRIATVGQLWCRNRLRDGHAERRRHRGSEFFAEIDPQKRQKSTPQS